MKLYKHELLTQYPAWEDVGINVSFTKDQSNPFSMFSLEEEEAKIMKDAELARKVALERGEDGKLFILSWYFQMTKEDFFKSIAQGIILEGQVDWHEGISAKPITVDDFIKLKTSRIIIPEQLYAMTEIELDDEFINLVDQYEAMAQLSWSGYNPEPYCQRQYRAAMREAKTDNEKAYVDSRNWC